MHMPWGSGSVGWSFQISSVRPEVGSNFFTVRSPAYMIQGGPWYNSSPCAVPLPIETMFRMRRSSLGSISSARPWLGATAHRWSVLWSHVVPWVPPHGERYALTCLPVFMSHLAISPYGLSVGRVKGRFAAAVPEPLQPIQR